MTWNAGPFLALDTETTGPDALTARVVTACLIKITPGQLTETHNWLIDPGVEISEGATAAHGISTEKARDEGQDAPDALGEIAVHLRQASASGVPLVAYNAAFDLTVLDRDLRRNDIPPLPSPRPVLDPFVLDKAVDRYRRGSRTLTATAAFYGVDLGDNAHAADADALAAVRVLWHLANRYPDLIGHQTPEQLHERQIDWYAEQKTSLAEYFRKQGKEVGDMSTEWPMRTVGDEQAVA